VEMRYFPMLVPKISLTQVNFMLAWSLETASLLIATVRAVPWREHADEAVENFPVGVANRLAMRS
jgi:hypothetical protein